MRKHILLFAVTCFVGLTSYSQGNTDLKGQITQKETELANAANSSRQVNTTIKAELNKLYIEYKSELETQLKSITDEVLLARKKEELEVINNKIENYSQQK
ncbi:hypothetical protein H9Y05_00390 [Crocinitomicaceae bacterium CZZ-1]|uniref:Adhesion protein FadA n=1 Tax=Taishania pollutisoli TaxID=2766479 RepID=A0A8J6P6W9_9FLAO|nr:hypothetical protein [Taishania pollutisoli]MBC9810921.1 hypothetical protein [Taishania pollutisoli]MBX2950078.1 hypothetical protein [Crocinitomicaceae bacterium]NGF77184.1 hypothetical protein [Fluviicola sp. SGL-29]